jgi:ribosomal protein L37AE/L43A
VESYRNPSRRSGERNVFCSFYGECLNDVVRRGWDSWECSKCEHETDHGAAPEFQLSAGHSIAYYEIVTKI